MQVNPPPEYCWICGDQIEEADVEKCRERDVFICKRHRCANCNGPLGKSATGKCLDCEQEG